MNRTTIDYGIDLGTTNSSIALASGTDTEVIRNALDAELTPSAVHINAAGALWVGQHARARLVDERAAGQVAVEFKRRIGTGYEYTFAPSGRKMLPEALSAEVLKSLRADVARGKGEEIAAIVITVPAAFELHQCEATKRAADLAGFSHAALLQEPVAAALAYGYQKIDARACWLVFDFGGGTFDAALVSSRDGAMHVINHGGDSFLGGADIDLAIVQHLLVPRIHRDLRAPDFRLGDPRYTHDLLRLKAAAETAKIELAQKSQAHLEVVLGSISPRPVTLEATLTQAEVARLAEPIAVKAADIALRVLREKNLAPAAVAKLLFVGGPTLAPWFRDVVQDRLGIAADHTIDPLTAVARGAAIFASTQPMPRPAVAPAPAPASERGFTIEILAKRVGSDLTPLVSGRVLPPAGQSLAGYTIEFINPATKWRSGRHEIRPGGAFLLTLHATPAAPNRCQLELRTPAGALCATTPDHFDYTLGVVIEEQPIINTLGVATADNRVGLHFTKGQPLPARSTRTYRTSRELLRGDTSDALRIPIIEGNRPLADRNFLIGMLLIRAANLQRDLPLGSEIEVTLRMDTSRLLTVQAYVPLIDAEFPATLELGGKVRQPDLSILRQELAREQNRFAALTLPADLSDEIQAAGATIESLHAQLSQTLLGGAADFDTLLRAERDLMELKDRVDAFATLLAWPVAAQEAESWLHHFDLIIENHGTDEDRVRAISLRAQTRVFLMEKNLDRLRRKTAELSDAYAAIAQREPSFWTDHLEILAQRLPQMRDQPKAGLLLKRGRHAAATAQLETVKEVVFQLQELLPPPVAQPAALGYGSNLVH
ncbi:MAG: Hsp70 family protein [Opitutae bacterium]|nr:Hsp70 family protein [Opitutae bacterium]